MWRAGGVVEHVLDLTIMAQSGAERGTTEMRMLKKNCTPKVYWLKGWRFNENRAADVDKTRLSGTNRIALDGDKERPTKGFNIIGDRYPSISDLHTNPIYGQAGCAIPPYSVRW